MSVYEVRSPQFIEIIKRESPTPHIFVDFCADWCSPCRAIDPKIRDLAKQYPEVTFLKVNIEESPQLSEKYNIQSLPTFMLFERGDLRPSHPRIEGAHLSRVKRLLEESVIVSPCGRSREN